MSSIDRQITIHHHSEVTHILPTPELNARRRRKAFTAPLDKPQHTTEPARTGPRTVEHPGHTTVSRTL